MWVTKLLIFPGKIRIFCPKTSNFGLKLAFLFIAGSFGALLVGQLVVVARGLYLARHLFTLQKVTASVKEELQSLPNIGFLSVRKKRGKFSLENHKKKNQFLVIARCVQEGSSVDWVDGLKLSGLCCICHPGICHPHFCGICHPYFCGICHPLLSYICHPDSCHP